MHKRKLESGESFRNSNTHSCSLRSLVANRGSAACLAGKEQIPIS